MLQNIIGQALSIVMVGVVLAVGVIGLQHGALIGLFLIAWAGHFAVVAWRPNQTEKPEPRFEF